MVAVVAAFGTELCGREPALPAFSTDALPYNAFASVLSRVFFSLALRLSAVSRRRGREAVGRYTCDYFLSLPGWMTLTKHSCCEDDSDVVRTERLMLEEI